MSEYPIKSASNIKINKGSILLLFNDDDREILRSWSPGREIERLELLNSLIAPPLLEHIP